MIRLYWIISIDTISILMAALRRFRNFRNFSIAFQEWKIGRWTFNFFLISIRVFYNRSAMNIYFEDGRNIV